MKLAIRLCLVAVAMAAPLNAEASPITYAIAGVFGFSTEPLLPVGTSYNASLTFDSQTFSTSLDPFGGTRYSSGSFTFTGGTVSLSGPVSITIDSADDWLRIDSVSLTGTFTAGVRINLTGAGLTSDAFPIPLPSLSEFVDRQIVINRSSSTTGSITTFTPVPEPASLVLLVAGIGMFAATQRRRRSPR